ncbi:MAG: CDP-diacylglycerol--glycerol-3-phosphate 3-phosphatidyltransferase [bacterium]|nr:CDP-diacylglycerol--glycerol-3-phosphate 3-phosphatidyltransferase [bacterium]
MNLANILTLIRILFIPIFVIFLSYENVYTYGLATVTFFIACLTDLYDGKIARGNVTTHFGEIIDPLADKLLVSSALICFVGIPHLRIPSWMVILIISREFVVTGFRTLASQKGVIISASFSGKLKTCCQMIAIIIILLILAIRRGTKNPRILESIPFMLMTIVTLITIFSGFSHLIRNRELLRE